MMLLFMTVGASQVGPTLFRWHRLTVFLLWPLGHLVALRAPSSLRIIETSPYFWKDCLMAVSPTCPICPCHQAGGIPPHRMIGQQLQEWGWRRYLDVVTSVLHERYRNWSAPDVSIRLLSRLKVTAIKLRSELCGGGWQTQQSVKFKELATVWESCTRPFSFERRAPGVTLFQTVMLKDRVKPTTESRRLKQN